MNTLKGPMFVFLVMGFVVIRPLVCAQEAEPSEQEAMYYRYLEFASYVKGGNVDPHWMADGNSFWYAEGARLTPLSTRWIPRPTPKGPCSIRRVSEERSQMFLAMSRPMRAFPLRISLSSTVRGQSGSQSSKGN